MLTFASDSAMNLHIDNGFLRVGRRKPNESVKRACMPAAGLSRQPAVGGGDEARVISFAGVRRWVGEI
jgi:hypothetical protein